MMEKVQMTHKYSPCFSFKVHLLLLYELRVEDVILILSISGNFSGLVLRYV
jgi:hypothetical protein